MTQPVPTLPDEVAKRPLHFFWLLDWSGSMAGTRIASLNQALREAIPEVKRAIAGHPEVQVLMRCIKFADKAEWHVGPQAVDIEHFVCPELGTDGRTGTAQAIRMLCAELDIEKMPRRGYPPVCILVSDGFCTDPDSEYEAALAELDSIPWGKRAVRLAIAIGNKPGDFDDDMLGRFINQPNVGVIHAHNHHELVQYIKWASTTASVGSASGKSRMGADPGTNVTLPQPPPPPIVSADPVDVF